MDNRAERLREWLSPEGADHFDDIVLTRKLGASPNIYGIGRMYRDLAENAPARGLDSAELVARVKELSGFFGELRGESSHAILTAMRIMTKGLDAYASEPLERTREFLLKAHGNYEAMSAGWIEKIKEYGWNVLEDLSSMLVFDYSSTVNAMMETASEHGKKMTVYVPESRALDGGRPFVVNALKLGHSPVFFPDAALAAFTRKADVAFIGAETFFPDGSAANTVGSDLVAILCARFGKPLYVPTAMIKVNMRGIEGRRKKELGRDLARYLAAAWPEEMRAATDFCCPDLAIVGPAEITGYITELGVIPPAAMFGMSLRYIAKIEGEDE